MTTHGYFNLSSSERTIHNHVIDMPLINSALAIDEFQIPTGKYLTPKTSPSLFFTKPEILGPRIADPGLSPTKGFDHFFLSPKISSELVTVESQDGKLGMKVFTNAPGFQFYTGNWLSESLPSKKSHLKYGPYSGFCIEPSAPPDSINSSEFAHLVKVNVGESWKENVTYRFYSLK